MNTVTNHTAKNVVQVGLGFRHAKIVRNAFAMDAALINVGGVNVTGDFATIALRNEENAKNVVSVFVMTASMSTTVTTAATYSVITAVVPKERPSATNAHAGRGRGQDKRSASAFSV